MEKYGKTPQNRYMSQRREHAWLAQFSFILLECFLISTFLSSTDRTDLISDVTKTNKTPNKQKDQGLFLQQTEPVTRAQLTRYVLLRLMDKFF